MQTINKMAQVFIEQLGFRNVRVGAVSPNGTVLDVRTGEQIGLTTEATEPVTMDTGGGGFGYLGLPVFSDMILSGDTVLHLKSVVATVKQTKNISKVAVKGAKGTHKTYIEEGDFDINLRGWITDGTKNYPKAAVEAFIEIVRQSVALSVTSPFLEMFGITNIVVEDYEMWQEEATENVQFFSIKAVSDFDFDFVEVESYD